MYNNATRSVFIGLLVAVIIIVIFFITNYYHIVKVDNINFHAFLRHDDDHSRGDDAASSIPSKMIHQSWKTTKLPKRFQRWSQTWKTCFPTWKYRLWNDTENRDFVARYYPWFLKNYDGFKWHIHRVDSIRYLYLFHYGGIYSDLDNECLRPFEHLLSNYSLVFGAMTGQYASYIKEGYVQNSFMYSRPRHPFWLEMLHEVINRMKNSSPPEAIAGPITLVHCINMYRKRFTDDIKIYSPNYFNPNSWLKTRAPGCKDFNAMTEAEEKMCRKHYNSSYVIQYHTQTWGRGKVSRRIRRLL